MTVVIDGKEYVPKEYKISEEAVRLIAEANSETRHTPVHAKLQRIQYLLTGPNGKAR